MSRVYHLIEKNDTFILLEIFNPLEPKETPTEILAINQDETTFFDAWDAIFHYIGEQNGKPVLIISVLTDDLRSEFIIATKTETTEYEESINLEYLELVVPEYCKPYVKRAREIMSMSKSSLN